MLNPEWSDSSSILNTKFSSELALGKQGGLESRYVGRRDCLLRLNESPIPDESCVQLREEETKATAGRTAIAKM